MKLQTMILSTLGGLTLWPAAAPAQEPRRERVEVRVPSRLEMVTTRRARLGVFVDTRANDNDSIGATISSVTPGGPAAKAGIQSGDIITRLDGQSLLGGGASRSAEAEESVPALRLIELVSKLEPNDTISVEYRRGGARRTATVVTGNEPAYRIFAGAEGAPGLPGFDRFPEFEGRIRAQQMPDGGYIVAFGGPLASLELAPLNADLGSYFGTSEGVLVISVPRESTLGLKGGDVILSIGERKTTSPSGLLRILRSYDPGESIRFEIMRNKSRQTVTGMVEKSGKEE